MRTPPFLLLVLAANLGACSGSGLRSPAQPEALKQPRAIAMRLHAAPKLNTDARGRPLALVARVYTLRQNAAFEAAPYATFLTPGADQAAFGPDLLDVKDVTLVPGQRYEVVEKVSREAAYVGIVALFHSPAPQRWRMSFAAAEAEKAGITVAVQACTLTAGTPTPAPVRCQ